MAIKLDNLPVEILFHLMSYLNSSDRQMLGLTCHRLHDIWLECAVDGDRRIVVKEETLRNIHFTSRIRSLILQNIHLADEYESARLMWFHWSENLHNLEFHNCEMDENSFLNIIARCPNLVSLHIVNCNNLFMSGNLLQKPNDLTLAQNSWRHLRKLNLSRNRYLSDSLFNRLITAATNISSLSLSNCQISFHPAIYRRFYPPSQLEPSISVFTFQNVLTLIKTRASSFKSINISNTLIDGECLSVLCNIPNLILNKLYLSSCEQLSETALMIVSRTQRELTTLDLSQSSRLNNRVVKATIDSLYNLKKFNITSCRSVTNFPSLKSTNKMNNLNLSGCENITKENLRDMFSEGHYNSLRTLNLSACDLDESSVILLAQKALNLQSLDLSSCRPGVTDRSLRAICKGLRSLQTLILSWCELVSDQSLSRDTLPSIHGLRHLDLCACVHITDSGVKRAIRFLELQNLNLSLCKELTDDGIVALGEANPSIEKVQLSQCHRLTDLGLSSAIAHWPRLKYLDVQGCKNLSDSFLTALALHCPRIRYLDVSICFGITLTGIRHFQRRIESSSCQIHYRHINPSSVDGYTQNV